jgi:hypothetical protein
LKPPNIKEAQGKMSKDYQKERRHPKAPSCQQAKISLLFNGTFLYIFGNRPEPSYPAVSGRPDDKKQFNYSIERQTIPGEGPIPEGQYWVQPSELWENNWFKSVFFAPRSAWGNFRLAIHPYPNTQTYTRGGFFIHGGSTPGSAGCIDLTMHMDSFIEKLSNILGGQPTCHIPLTVRYPKP